MAESGWPTAEEPDAHFHRLDDIGWPTAQELDAHFRRIEDIVQRYKDQACYYDQATEDLLRRLYALAEQLERNVDDDHGLIYFETNLQEYLEFTVQDYAEYGDPRFVWLGVLADSIRYADCVDENRIPLQQRLDLMAHLVPILEQQANYNVPMQDE